MSADLGDADGTVLPAGVTAGWWEKSQARLRWKAEGDQVGAEFGISVATAGDVNGDGYDDVIVGAEFYDNGQTDQGRAFVYHGSASGLSLMPDWTAEANQANARFGNSLGTAGDVNGDGYDDVIVGAFAYDNGETNEGRAFAYLGSASGLSLTPDWTAEGDEDSANFGYSVGTAGDVNGDGYEDVIVGARSYDNGELRGGRAFVYHGSASGLSTIPDWTADGDQSGAEFGNQVGTAGDVNGDGYDDVIVSAVLYDNGQANEGRAFVYHGSASGLSNTPDWMAEGNKGLAFFGGSLGTAGDVNGDGYDDIIVGVSQGGRNREGQAYVYQGSASGLSITPDWIAEGNQSGARFGSSAGTAGDANRDGYDDVVVGALLYDNGQTNEGRAFVYHGSASGLSLAPEWTAESNQSGAWFGSSAGTAGDANGDGYDDVIVGAPQYDHGESNEGAAVVFPGRATEASCSVASDSSRPWTASSR